MDSKAGENQGISKRARLIRDLVAEFNHNDFLKTKFRDEKRPVSEFDKAYRYPDFFDVKRYRLENFEMEFLRRNDLNSDWVLLQLHGGGYVGPIKNHYRNFAGLYSEMGHGMSVLTIDYRVAPDNPFPAALEDALAAYEWLLEAGYSEKRIILGGDSAGGGLALCLCHYLKQEQRELPAAIVMMSPWTDLTLSGSSYKEKLDKDPIFGNNDESLLYDNPYPGDHDKSDPLISPLFGDFEGFPPMLIQVGSEEMLLSDSTELAAKAKAAGVKVRLSVYNGMFHVFQLAAKLMPESKKAWSEVAKFVDTVMMMAEERSLRIAVAQTAIHFEAQEENILVFEDAVNLLGNRMVDIIFFPEMSFTGFSMNVEKTNVCKEEIIDIVGKLSAQKKVSIGFGWVGKEGLLAENHYTIVSPAAGDGEEYEVISDYVKLHPFSYAGEDKCFKAGDWLSMCEIDDYRIGSVICYDLRFPEIFQKLSKYCDIIAVPANWPAKRSEHWKTLLKARAIENQAYIVGINCCGNMDGQSYSGDSSVYNPEGLLLDPIKEISLPEDGRLMIYDINRDACSVRDAFPVKNDRREALYPCTIEFDDLSGEVLRHIK